MEFVERSEKLGEPRTVTKRSSASSPPPEKLQLSTSKRMKRNGNVDPAVTSLNPLLIPHIVKNISSYLVSMEDMKNIRALSRLWRDECLERWRSTAVLVLTSEAIRALIQGYLRENNPEPESTSNDAFFQLFEKPFRNFRYPSDCDGRNQIVPLQPLDIGGPSPILWEQFFSKAKYLDLGDCIMKDEVYYLEGFKWIFQTCPELKRLDLNPYYYQDKRHVQNRLAVLNANADLSSNLEALSIGESCAAGFLNYNSGVFRLRHVLDVITNIQEHLDGNPLQSLFQICPNLKNLWMQEHAWNLLDAAQLERRQLESLAIVPPKGYQYFNNLRNYLQEVRPPLKKLVLRFDAWRNIFPRPNEVILLFQSLNLVQATLTKLELYIDCEMEGIFKRPLNLASEGGGGTRTFSNLTHLKICQDYRKFKENLISFDFGSLRQMKKLKEFRFEMGVAVAEAWVKKNLSISGDIHGILLPDLEHFHFHGNFAARAIQFLGKVAVNLKTLEVVLDGENFTTALKAWTGLSQITLLPCSEVPAGWSEPEGLKIVDKSKDYLKASFVI